MVVRAPSSLLDRLLAGRAAADPVTHLRRVPARSGLEVDWPEWAPSSLLEAYAALGVKRPWTHQVQTAEAAHAGHSVVLATGTASGKSLAYQLPVLSTLAADPRATAIYLAPTKALAGDQWRMLDALDPPRVYPSTFDGDTPLEERDWVRAHARLILTNPDMLHHSVLPRHSSWGTFLRRLRYVVVDECHAYRGVFGSHVAHVLRRLRRVAARYGSEPVFVLASATVSDPAASAERLTGLRCVAVTDDGSPRGATTFALWEPPLLPGAGMPLRRAGDPTAPMIGNPEEPPCNADDPGWDVGGGGEHGAPVRRPATAETADLLADLVVEGVRTLAFVRSRRSAEVVALGARRALSESVPELVDRIAAYRGGYLPEERRALEDDLSTGRLLGVASTNALELGVDISGLDAVLLAGYPGTLASLWQQAGRAGRDGQEALAVLVARDDPLDTYLVHHPEAVFGRPVESTVLDPANPYVLAPHLCCAASELPLTDEDVALFGGGPARAVLDELVAARVLRRRATGWYWTARERPDADLRGTGGEPVSVVETETGRLLGTVDAGSAHTTVHPGAVYLHQGEAYMVDDLDLEGPVALVHAEDPDWTTYARDVTDVEVVDVRRTVQAGPVQLHLGDVDVTSQVVSYLRRRLRTGEVLDETPLDLPARQLRTVAVWYTVTDAALATAGVDSADVPGALHAAEHAAIGLLPLVATCDRWDVGGLSTALHADTGRPTVFVHDGHPGGAGFAERGFDRVVTWLTATRDAIAACACSTGCPSCVQSPKCGNGNDPLDKAGAVRVLELVLSALDGAGPNEQARPNEPPTRGKAAGPGGAVAAGPA